MIRHPNPSGRLFPFMLVLVAVTLGACGSTTTAVDQPLDIIDALVHTSFDNKVFVESKVMFSKEDLAAEMKRNHVVGAVSINRPGDDYIDLSDLNVIQCTSLGVKVDTATLEARFRSGSCRCIEISPGDAHLRADDPAYEHAYGLAETFHVPVVLRTGPTELTYSEPRAMESAVRRHPNVTFVLAHDGSPLTADERDRDAFLAVHRQPTLVWEFGDDPWIQAAAEVAYRNPNVVLDGSALLAGDLRGDSREQIRTYVERRVSWILHYVTDPRKLMFGSGWPLTDVDIYIEAFKSAIPSSYWQVVFHDNAARVYGFGKASPTN